MFDRGGWSPKFFADLIEEGFDILTYNKGKARPAFSEHEMVDNLGRCQHYWPVERDRRLAYRDDERRPRYFPAH